MFRRFHGRKALSVVGICAFITAHTAFADDLTFAVHPILPAKETFRVYQPLADYLTKTTGHNVQLATTSNFLVHWQLSKRNIYHLILEGPHMVDYRISKMGYKLVARMPDLISYSLVADENQLAMEPADLVGKSVATMPAPSLGAVHLNQFFPNPLRQPVLVEVDNLEEAMERVASGQSVGALIPSAAVGRFDGLTTVATTDQAPAPGITASPEVSESVRNAISKALIEAHQHPEGRAALALLNIPRFEAASARHYAGYSRLLEGMWGY
ncbi:MAG: phosphate/phosphite/phosphonate ABC transporter substrate-binding protein [Thiohalomonadaceae bacterium]